MYQLLRSSNASFIRKNLFVRTNYQQDTQRYVTSTRSLCGVMRTPTFVFAAVGWKIFRAVTPISPPIKVNSMKYPNNARTLNLFNRIRDKKVLEVASILMSDAKPFSMIERSCA